MSACNFTIPFTADAKSVLNKAKKTVEDQDGTFTGDEKAGNFNVSVFGNTIIGTYAVEGQNINIDISEKPFLVPCNMIESFLKSKMS